MSRVSTALDSAVLAFLGVKCAVLVSNLAAFPVLAPAAPATSSRRVSLLVPARDEEHNLRRTLPGLLAQPADEILVLDDGSTDESADLVRALLPTNDRLRLLHGEELPDGWGGKNWACHQLATAATGDLLVFADADVTLAPGALEAIVAEADRQDADVFSVFPRQTTGTLGERAVVPLIDDVLLCMLPHGLLRLPVPSAATANGQLLAFRRSAYETLGGHSAIRASAVEDVRMARRTRSMGLQLGLALGGDLVSVRMYEGYAAMVAGMAKSLRPAHGGSRALMVATATWHLLAYTAPWVRAAVRPRDVSAWAAIALAVAERVGVNAKTGRGAWWEAALMPAAPVAALPVYARAARRTRVWKGRTYA